MRFSHNWSLLIPIALFASFMSGCSYVRAPNQGSKWIDDRNTRATDEAIEKDDTLKELAAICSSIPKRDDYVLVSKGLSHVPPPELFYNYSSSEDFETARMRFHSYLQSDDWHLEDTGQAQYYAEYRKGPYRISIQFGRMGRDANYGFSCEKRGD